MSPILELRKATKEFRGVPAIKNIDFTLERGEIHAIVGENGAGKSTLTKVLAGVYKLTSGEMLFDGKPMTLSAPSEALALGIAMVFQETNLVPSMTVAQNIYLGEEKLFNRLRGLYIQAQQFLAVDEFSGRSDRARLLARRRAKADGRDRPRRPSQGAHHHLRRADRLADARRRRITSSVWCGAW